MIERSLIRRALIGLAVFAGMVILGVVFAAGGDQGARRPTPVHVTAASVTGSERSRRHAAGVTRPRPHPRASKGRATGSRSHRL